MILRTKNRSRCPRSVVSNPFFKGHFVPRAEGHFQTKLKGSPFSQQRHPWNYLFERYEKHKSTVHSTVMYTMKILYYCNFGNAKKNFDSSLGRNTDRERQNIGDIWQAHKFCVDFEFFCSDVSQSENRSEEAIFYRMYCVCVCASGCLFFGHYINK